MSEGVNKEEKKIYSVTHSVRNDSKNKLAAAIHNNQRFKFRGCLGFRLVGMVSAGFSNFKSDFLFFPSDLQIRSVFWLFLDDFKHSCNIQGVYGQEKVCWSISKSAIWNTDNNHTQTRKTDTINSNKSQIGWSQNIALLWTIWLCLSSRLYSLTARFLCHHHSLQLFSNFEIRYGQTLNHTHGSAFPGFRQISGYPQHNICQKQPCHGARTDISDWFAPDCSHDVNVANLHLILTDHP